LGHQVNRIAPIHSQTTPDRDDNLWQQARQRVSLRRHTLTSLALIAFFTAVWYFTGPYEGRDAYFWPILGWGIGLASHGFAASSSGAESAVEREYRKLSEK